jgi:hypothetical protein
MGMGGKQSSGRAMKYMQRIREETPSAAQNLVS